MHDPVRFRVVESEHGTMLFQLLARRLPDTTLAQAKALVRAGGVYMGHLRVRVPSVRVEPGERITVYRQAAQSQPLPDDALVVVHRDPAFVILDKPAGIAVAQTKVSARGTLAEALRHMLGREGTLRPYVGVVHRLDQSASGLVLFTIRSVANKSLHRQFTEHRIARHYRVLVHGDAASTLTCDAPLRPARGGRVEVADAGDRSGRAAKTILQRLPAHEPVEGRSLLGAQLTTGRTHQIRVHCAHAGLPIVGDHKYGPRGVDVDGSARLHLHAHRLVFEHPLDGSTVDVRAQLPAWARTTDDDTTG
jgi:RluA family pseudouridine synthase